MRRQVLAVAIERASRWLAVVEGRGGIASAATSATTTGGHHNRHLHGNVRRMVVVMVVRVRMGVLVAVVRVRVVGVMVILVGVVDHYRGGRRQGTRQPVRNHLEL